MAHECGTSAGSPAPPPRKEACTSGHPSGECNGWGCQALSLEPDCFLGAILSSNCECSQEVFKPPHLKLTAILGEPVECGSNTGLKAWRKLEWQREVFCVQGSGTWRGGGGAGGEEGSRDANVGEL